MKTFKVRGKARIVGSIVQPSHAARGWLRARGSFHALFGDAGCPAPPATLDYITPALASLSTMLGNGPDPANPPAFPNGMGDCVCAMDHHLNALRACNAGAPYIPQTADAISTYSAVTGFDPTNPNSDQGTDPMALLKYRLDGAAYPDGSKMLAAFEVDATNKLGLQQALWLADGVIFWAGLCDAWESEEDGGDIWDVGTPDQANGHGFGGGGYDDVGISLIEWGEESPPIKLTYAAAAVSCIESAGGGCVAVLGSNAFSRITGLCPSGQNLSQLQAYLAALGAPVAA